MPLSADDLYEQSLVIRARLGDEKAFAELLERHGPRLFSFVERMMQSASGSVPDLVQEIWIAIYRALPGLQDASKFRPWTFRIARDRIYREYRRRRIAWEPIESLAAEPAVEEDAAELPFETHEMQRSLAALSPAHREALLLRFFEDLTYEQIAQLTGATVGTIRSRIHYAKRALRESLAKSTL